MNRKKLFLVSFSIFLSLSLAYSLFLYPIEEGEYPFILPVRAATRSDENTDSDSNIDAVANKGTTNTSYLDAQSKNDAYQGITEADDGGGGGSVTVENSYTATGKKTTSNTISSVVVPTSTGRAIYVMVAAVTKNSESNLYVSAITRDSQSFSMLGEAQNVKTTSTIWYLLNPNQNTADVVVDWDNNNANWQGYTIALEVLSGVDVGGTPHDTWETPTEGSSTSATHNVATASGDLVYGVMSKWSSSTATENGDGTEIYQSSNTNNQRGAIVKFTADDSSSALSYSLGDSQDWTFAGVSINPAGGGVNYRLEWEHQATSVPTGGDNYYNLTIFGSSTENIDVYMWNSSDSNWHTTAIGTITSTNQWYNWSISGVGLTGATITWLYNDTIVTSDTTQHTLAIDYAGVFVWSMTITVNQDPINVTAIPNAGDTEYNQFPTNFTIDAGANFDLEIKCTEGNGSVCSGNWLFWDTDNNPSGYTQLTTTYQIAYSNQDKSTTNLNIWLWASVPNGETLATYSWTLDVRITTS